MQIQNLVAVLLISCVSSLSFNTMINKHVFAQTTDQIQELRDMGAAIIMPNYIPLGFQLDEFNATTETQDPGYANGYYASYKGPNNCKIEITGTDGGLGAPDPVRRWEVNTPLFGKIILVEFDGSTYNPPRANDLFAFPTEQLPDSPIGYTFIFRCDYSLFSPQEASQILKSMQIAQ